MTVIEGDATATDVIDLAIPVMGIGIVAIIEIVEAEIISETEDPHVTVRRDRPHVLETTRTIAPNFE